MKGGGAAKPPRAKGELTFGMLAAAVVFRAERRLNNRRKKIKAGKPSNKGFPVSLCPEWKVRRTQCAFP